MDKKDSIKVTNELQAAGRTPRLKRDYNSSSWLFVGNDCSEGCIVVNLWYYPDSMKRAYERFQMWVWRMPLPVWLRAVLLWLGNQKFLASVSMVIFNERGEVLLLKHTYRRDMPWGLPGGWLKANESPECAIARELMEETGLMVRVIRPVWVGNRHNFPCVEVVYLGALEQGTFRPSDEVSEMRYFPIDGLPSVTEEMRNLLELAWVARV